ncbi:anthranilate synthase component I family protein [Staphylococcus kloosii]|uniref:anthranilate synthase component I family protein n=1 Tax=Staphylococcus kloosii TaxID=29384 RepID=UPI0028A366FA|nr:anthranilate synthase component I family protein [Staphylococcus kloosii]MDT3958331.1 anthranilate synthase component I family protein [Staphylococcus kloosii]
MHIQFNYRYMNDENDFETYHIECTDYSAKKIAWTIDEVGAVVSFAEMMQKQNKYVALYLPYEAANFYNEDMAVVNVQDPYVYAVAYVFDSVKQVIGQGPNTYAKCHNFQFLESNEILKKNIERIQQEIIKGNTYQVNYTTRLTDNIRRPIYDLYQQLQLANNGNYSVMIDTDELKIASASPELFFQQGTFKNNDNVIVSKPMKGTISRGVTPADDEMQYKTLAQSQKDKAENVMIVDLLRNDIARIAATNSVNVYKLFHIEKYDTVFQMTSMVTGQLAKTTSLNKILASLFPCGSITGAPKVNTMKFIKTLEQVPRHVYCGTIGLLMPNGKSIFNVPIRTIQYIGEQAIYGVGAGITIDSQADKEIIEFNDKVKILERL